MMTLVVSMLGFCITSFAQLVFRSLKSSPAATFLEADDVNKAMTPLRAAVEEASCDPQVSM